MTNLGYQSIAEIAGKSEAACRQLMVRARAALGRAREVPPPAANITASIVTRFIAALANGDEKELLGIMAQDAVLVATVNSGPGMLAFRDGQLISVVSVSIEGDSIAAIYAVNNNPERIHSARS